MADKDKTVPGEPQDRDARLVRAMGEAVGMDISAEKALDDLERPGPRQGREDGMSAGRVAVYLMGAVLLAVCALWFSNESARLHNEVLGFSGESSPGAPRQKAAPPELLDAPRAEPTPEGVVEISRRTAIGASERRDWALAARMARRGVEASGHRDEGLLRLLARAEAELGHIDEAIGAWVAADKLERRGTDGHRAAARLAATSQRPDEALGLLGAARDRGDTSPSLHLEMGALHHQRGSYRDAVVAYERGDIAKRGALEDVLRYAESLERLQRPEEALKAYRHARDLEPADGRAPLAIARFEAQKGDLDAVQAWKTSGGAGGAPGDAAALEAYAALKAGRFKEAAALLERLVPEEGKPAAPELLRNYAIALQRSGRARQALRIWKRAAEASPSDRDVRLAYGNLLRQSGRHQRAIDQLRQALALGDGSDVRMELGLAHSDDRDHTSAAAHFRALLGREPDHEGALRSLGVAQLALGQDEEALQSFRRMAALAPANVDLQLTIGALLTKMGRTDEAKAALEVACAGGIAEACAPR